MPLKPLISIACLLAAAGAYAAEAPAELEPVLVTAALRPLPASERAGGVTVLAGADLRDSAVVHLEELLPRLPPLVVPLPWGGPWDLSCRS